MSFVDINIWYGGGNYYEMDKIDVPNVSGVYFIYNSKMEIIYVGQTKSLFNRTIQHFQTDLWFKAFARYMCYILIKNEDLRETESYFINKLKPLFNIEHYNILSDGEMKDVVREKPVI